MRLLGVFLATVVPVMLGGLNGLAAAQIDDGVVMSSAGCDKPLVAAGDYEGINDVGDDAGPTWARCLLILGPTRLAPVPHHPRHPQDDVREEDEHGQ